MVRGGDLRSAGRTLVAGGSTAVSGIVRVAAALLLGLTRWLVVPVFPVWEVAVVTDPVPATRPAGGLG